MMMCHVGGIVGSGNVYCCQNCDGGGFDGDGGDVI